jgi:hypothetical protein
VLHLGHLGFSRDDNVVLQGGEERFGRSIVVDGQHLTVQPQITCHSVGDGAIEQQRLDGDVRSRDDVSEFMGEYLQDL